jgi:4-hydroxybenzoyl-CoA reductase subunit beta
MMRLPAFDYFAPSDVREAATILANEGPDAMVLGGGTDLFPKMKRRQQTPRVLVSLRRIPDLHGLSVGAGKSPGARLGASATLTQIAEDPLMPQALRAAAGVVGTPHLRNAATLGGNLFVDTRCTYYDQNYEWRESISFCLKRSGDTCWVAPGSDRCLAVSSTDCAPALIALDGEALLASVAGERLLPLAELYADDGIAYSTRRLGEIVVGATIPDRTGWRSTYWKLRRRGSIDFPVLSVAAAIRFGKGKGVEDARLVLGAVASNPRVVKSVKDILVGRELTDDRIEQIAEHAAKLAKPMDNTDFQLHWRKAVCEPYVAAALRELRGDDPATFTPLARRASRAVSSVMG